MINLFKEVVRQLSTTSIQRENAVIEEIHMEFDSAQDRLLQQADSLLAELKIPTETQIEKKANRLELIGFKNTVEVAQAKALRERKEDITKLFISTREQAELLKYYKHAYPFQKFLTVKELDRICSKYGLVHAPASNYKEVVPEKNLTEIEKTCPLRQSDLSEELIKVTAENGSYTKDGDKLKIILKALNKSNSIFSRQECFDLLKSSKKIHCEETCHKWSLFGDGFDMFFILFRNTIKQQTIQESSL